MNQQWVFRKAAHDETASRIEGFCADDVLVPGLCDLGYLVGRGYCNSFFAIYGRVRGKSRHRSRNLNPGGNLVCHRYDHMEQEAMKKKRRCRSFKITYSRICTTYHQCELGRGHTGCHRNESSCWPNRRKAKK